MQAQRFYPGLPAPQGIGNGRYSPSQYARSRTMATTSATNLFAPTIDDSIFHRAEVALAAGMDVKMPPMGGSGTVLRPTDMFPSYHPGSAHLPTTTHHGGTMDFSSLPESMSTGPMMMTSSHVMSHATDHQVHSMAAMHPSPFPQYAHPAVGGMPGGPFGGATLPPGPAGPRFPPGMVQAATTGEPDTDPRELERFAEHFKQRRIKLGVTQADVGKALAHLKMPGVGSLSQSTICRFESLTLSHNNMVALKPILHSWLEKAEEVAKGKNETGILPNTEKKRKRTSIAAPEKRSLEAFFSLQPRPSGEKIAAIAEKLDLKKNVVRVWFCNQRQKQKRCRNQGGGRVQKCSPASYFGSD